MPAKQPKPINCLLCQRPAAVRGLCRSHYETYRKAKNAAPDQEVFEYRAIEQGIISAEDKRLAKNPFADLLAQLQSEFAAESKETYKKNS